MIKRLPVRIEGSEGLHPVMNRAEVDAWAKTYLAKGETFTVQEKHGCWVIRFHSVS